MKGASILEYIMNYGWAILIILVVIAGIYSIYSSNQQKKHVFVCPNNSTLMENRIINGTVYYRCCVLMKTTIIREFNNDRFNDTMNCAILTGD